jgi:hypothetical protein
VVRVAISPHDDATAGRAQPGRVFDEGVENRLKIECRATNHLQDLCSSRLLLERLSQVAVPRVQLPKQADVLDGNDGLVSEGLEEGDLIV